VHVIGVRVDIQQYAEHIQVNLNPLGNPTKRLYNKSLTKSQMGLHRSWGESFKCDWRPSDSQSRQLLQSISLQQFEWA